MNKQLNNPDFLVHSLTTLQKMVESNNPESEAYLLKLAEDIRQKSAKEAPYHISFLIRLRDKQVPILVSDIAFVNFENDTVYLYDFKGEKHTIFKTLDEVEKAVSPCDFYRINRQILINRKAIKGIESHVHQKQIVHLSISFPEQVLVSKLRVAAFLTWIEKGFTD